MDTTAQHVKRIFVTLSFSAMPQFVKFAQRMAQDEILKLTLSLLQTFKLRETENNWNESSNIIKEISNALSSNDAITELEIDCHFGQIMSVLEITVMIDSKCFNDILFIYSVSVKELDLLSIRLSF